MSNTAAIIIALAIALHAAAGVLISLSEDSEVTGKYQVVQASDGFLYRIDTQTGETWWSVMTKSWFRVGESRPKLHPFEEAEKD